MQRMHRGMNQDLVQGMNRSLLLHLLREEKMCSRVHLAKLSNLKQATVTNITSDFIGWGLINEVGFLSGNKGRRSIGISIDTTVYRVIGLRLARKYFKVGLFDLAGECHWEQRIDTGKDFSPNQVVEKIIDVVSSLRKSHQKEKLLAVGMALPGPFITKKGRIALMTENDNWNDIPLKETLEDALHLPVFLEHDANAGVLAQMWNTPAMVTRSTNSEYIMVYIAAGQGIGAGIVKNGELIKGAIGTAGEIGHTTVDMNGYACACGNKGCLEKYCSSIAFLRKINGAQPNQAPLDFTAAANLVRQGDPTCVQAYEEAVKYLGIGLVNLIYSYNPNTIIVGDEMATVLPQTMLEILSATIKERILPEIYDNMTISLPLTDKEAILHGAGIVAINEIFEDPLFFINQ